MQLTNGKLIALVTKLGEEKTLSMLSKKIEDDEYRREYHRKYNVKKAEIVKLVKANHPEIFEAAKAAVN
jgi:hypothetical protein